MAEVSKDGRFATMARQVFEVAEDLPKWQPESAREAVRQRAVADLAEQIGRQFGREMRRRLAVDWRRATARLADLKQHYRRALAERSEITLDGRTLELELDPGTWDNAVRAIYQAGYEAAKAEAAVAEAGQG